MSDGPPPDSRISRVPVLIITTLMPILYVTSLVPLANKGFASRCEDWPSCGGFGVAVSNLIETPQATGAFSALFFWPMTHLWSRKHITDDDRLSRWAFVCIFLGAALFVVCPLSLLPRLHTAAGFTLCLASMIFYRRMMQVSQPSKLCKALMAMGCLACSARAVAMLLFHFEMVKPLPTYLMFVLDATALNCLAALPITSRHDDIMSMDDPITHGWALVAETTSQALKPVDRCILLLMTFGPVLYLWCLPLLTRIDMGPCSEHWQQQPYGCAFAYRCDKYPSCDRLGESVSDLICTPQASGAMAITFFGPFLRAWAVMERLHWQQMWAFSTLMVFYVGFVGFLSLPWTKKENHKVHFLFVGSFCSAVLIHGYFLLTKLLESDERRFKTMAFLVVGVICLFGVGIVDLLTEKENPMKVDIQHKTPWLFWSFETAGLSVVLLFPWFWQPSLREDHVDACGGIDSNTATNYKPLA